MFITKHSGCKITLWIASFIVISMTSSAQHDFDSLWANNPEFKKLAKSTMDTLDIFSSEQPVLIVLESDFKALIKNKYKDEYQEAYFKYNFNDTVEVNRKIKIKPRGNFRRQNCHFPPIKLNFPKGAEKIRQLEEFDKMKMVVDCQRSKTNEQWLLNEFLTYKLYNILMDKSYRVRLLRVKYKDTSGRYKDYEQYAFIIEPTGQLARRLNSLEIEKEKIRDSYTDQHVTMIMYLFQFLIGNTDWSIPGLHNIKMFKSTDPTVQLPFVVPYDFDYSGIVNTSYAIPHELLGIETVRERKYWGYCRPKSEVDEVVAFFNSKKDDIYNLYRNSGLLDDKYLKSTLKYIDEFYQIITNENALRRDILEGCRQ
jgi:hypothetical protein